MPDLYFNRVPSLPATDDGSGKPLTEDLSTGSDDGEDIAWDADTAEAGPRDGEAEPGRRSARPDGEAEFTEADVAFLSAPQEANATVAANGTVTEDAPGQDAAAAIGESGRWFRPAKAKKYVPIPPEDQDGSAGLDVAPADPEPAAPRRRRSPRNRATPRRAGARGTGRGGHGEHAIWPGRGRGRGRGGRGRGRNCG